MIYYISDYHFYNEQFVSWRGFRTVEEMNNSMAARWNSRVTDEDLVVLLGDFSHGTGAQTNCLLQSLNGRKLLLVGNHDPYLEDPAFDRSLLEEIVSYKEMQDGEHRLVLSHYPLLCYNGQYREVSHPEQKTWMLYGHVHHSFDETMINEYLNRAKTLKRRLEGHAEPAGIPCNLINCFCRFSDYVPLSLAEWIALDAKRREELTRRTEEQRKNNEITF